MSDFCYCLYVSLECLGDLLEIAGGTDQGGRETSCYCDLHCRRVVLAEYQLLVLALEIEGVLIDPVCLIPILQDAVQF